MILSKRPDVDRFLTRPDPAVRAAVIYGRDRSGVRERADRLAGQVVRDPDDPFDVSLLSEADLEAAPERLEEALTAQSMTGGRRLVRVRLSSEKAGPDKACAAALKLHLDGALNPDAFLLVEGGALGRESGLRKAAEAGKQAVCIPCYEDEAGDIARMTRESLARNRVALTSDALEMFVARLPRERGLVRQEIERLALYIGPGSDRTLNAAELEAFLGVEPDASLYDAASQAFGARMAQAQASVRRAFAEGESGPAAVRAVGGHLGKLNRIRVLTASGAGPKEAAKAAGVFWKQEAEMLRQARAWPDEALAEVRADMLNAEIACKTTGSPDALIAERLLLEIAGRARRLGL